MLNTPTLNYAIKDLLELNLAYMPFIQNGGLFIPTAEHFQLGDLIYVELQLPTKNKNLSFEGKIVWLTPKNSLHHVVAGVGIQFIGDNAAAIRSQLEMLLDKSVEIGGYTYGISDDSHYK